VEVGQLMNMKRFYCDLLETVGLLSVPIVWLYGFIGLLILIYNSESVILGDYIQIFILIALTVTAIITIWVHVKNKILLESEVYLDRAIVYANKAFDVLQKDDGSLTDNRMSWVSAARLITRSIALREEISLQAHKAIYESERDYQRHKFIKLLALDGAGHIFTFFTGANVHEHINGNRSGGLNDEQDMIPKRAVSVVFRYASFPQDFEDPLKN
jgi:cell division protein FtsL